jgi:predicted Zn-dependent protease
MRWEAVGSRPGRRWEALATAVFLVAAAAQPTLAQGKGVNIARDAETEALIQGYLQPLLKAAGLRAGSVQVLLIPDPNFNAFVADPTKMFINTGTIIDSETPNELIGVLAHETAHLAHGDLAGIRQSIGRAQNAALIAGLIGIGTAIAGAAAGIEGLGQAGSAVAAGGMHVATRNVLMYQRAQEAAADRSAIDYLNKTGQSGAGMVKTLKRLADQMLLIAQRVDPYVQSHPLPAERVIALEALVAKSRFADRKDAPELQARHDLVRAKLVGFTYPPDRLARKYPMTDKSLAARYARAIASYRRGALKDAMPQIDGLIKAEPNNAYFRELRGQALLEHGKPKESVEPLRKAVSLAPGSGLLRILFGQALVATGSRGNVDEAISNLTVGLQKDPDVPVGYRALARAYAMKNDIAMAELATAQGLFAEGNISEAKNHAGRAQAKLKAGTPAWLRADDIVSYNPPKLR